MQWEDTMVRKDTKGYDGTNGYDELQVVRNNTKGYDVYKSTIKKVQAVQRLRERT